MNKKSKKQQNMKRFIIWLYLVIWGLVSTILVSTCNRDEKPDITYVNFEEVMAHDTVAFKTAQQEYEFLVEANSFKREIGDHLFTAVDLIEELMNTYPCEKALTIDEIDNILTKIGYYKEIEQVDSLLRLSM